MARDERIFAVEGYAGVSSKALTASPMLAFPSSSMRFSAPLRWQIDVAKRQATNTQPSRITVLSWRVRPATASAGGADHFFISKTPLQDGPFQVPEIFPTWTVPS